jgi:uncharacterized protein (TIGR02145 family)
MVCSSVYPTRGICPEGWHIPLLDEWRVLYGLDSMATAWVAKGGDEYPDATDKYGLSILRAGTMQTTSFYARRSFFWSADDDGIGGSGTNYVYGFQLDFGSSSVISNQYSVGKGEGNPVRCLKDKEIVYGQLLDKRDGQVYKTVKIAGKTWMAQNLNYRYVLDPESADSSSFCFENKVDSCESLGRLYRWSAAMDSAALFSVDSKGCGYDTTCSAGSVVRGVCPEGWHLPTKENLEELVKAHGWSNTAMMEINPEGRYNWKYGSNVFGFSIKESNAIVSNGWYYGYAFLYSMTEDGEGNAFRAYIRPDSYYYPPEVKSVSKKDAYPVRCIQDEE